MDKHDQNELEHDQNELEVEEKMGILWFMAKRILSLTDSNIDDDDLDDDDLDDDDLDDDDLDDDDLDDDDLDDDDLDDDDVTDDDGDANEEISFEYTENAKLNRGSAISFTGGCGKRCLTAIVNKTVSTGWA